jgi:phosphate transport system permease protein
MILVILIGFISYTAFPAIQTFGLTAFFNSESWNPDLQHWGIWPLLITSLSLTIGSVCLATPLGILLAYYQLAYAQSYLSRIIQGILDIASGIPSVVYGFWGLTFLIPALAHWSHTGQGQGILAGSLLLAMMLIPIAAIVARNAFQAVPKEILIAGHALGLRKSTVWLKVMLPAAKQGILSGAIIQMTRALGETMAILMVCGNVIALPIEPFLSVKALTANIARDMGEASDLHRSALFATGLFLLIVIFLLIGIQFLLEKKYMGSNARTS